MSMHDDGRGRRAGPAPELQSSFANNQGVGTAQGGDAWSGSALDAKKSEVNSMAQGPARPLMGQGQQPIFGGGSSVFAPMPTYRPVTAEPQQAQQPQPPQQKAPEPAPAFNPYPPVEQPSVPRQPATPNYASPQPEPRPSGYPLPNYEPAYRAAGLGNAPQQPAPQPFPPQNFNGGGAQAYQNLNPYQPASFPEPNFSEPSFEPSQQPAPMPDLGRKDASFGEPSFTPPNFPAQSFGDASFPEPSFDAGGFAPQAPAPSPFGNLEAGLGNVGNSFSTPHQQHPQHVSQQHPQHQQQDASFEMFGEEPAQDFSMPPAQPSAPQSHVPASDPRRQLQAFDAVYDQPPQIGLGSAAPGGPAQNFYEAERHDADFLDDDQVMPPPNAGGKGSSLKGGRSVVMVASALLGAIALGGALAFAYKQSGGGIGSGGEPPLVQADNRPVKEMPADAGGKEFPHKNKLIYDRLTNGDEAESEQLVPRQEEIAVPALPQAAPGMAGMPGMPAPVATTDLVSPQTTQSVDMAAADDDGGPRKVKTMRVLPDGSVEMPEAPAEMAAAATEAATQAATQAAEQAAEMTASMPMPAETPALPQQMAAANPAPAAEPAPAAPSKYVVQLGAKKSQTEALATFADIQQKHPSLLGNYRPTVQKADLGAKGTWYRLRVGPVDNKGTADKLCSQLKSQGLPDCLVMAQ